MDNQNRQREKRKDNDRGAAPVRLYVYLNPEDHAALSRAARRKKISNSYAARIAIRRFCRDAAAEEIEAAVEDAPLFRAMQHAP